MLTTLSLGRIFIISFYRPLVIFPVSQSYWLNF